MVTELNRSDINRALAKAIAYRQCGKPKECEAWAATLVDLLGCAGILTPTAWAATRDCDARTGEG